MFHCPLTRMRILIANSLECVAGNTLITVLSQKQQVNHEKIQFSERRQSPQKSYGFLAVLTRNQTKIYSECKLIKSETPSFLDCFRELWTTCCEEKQKVSQFIFLEFVRKSHFNSVSVLARRCLSG